MNVDSGELDGENGGIGVEGLRDGLFKSRRSAQIDLAANADDGGAVSVRDGRGNRIRS